MRTDAVIDAAPAVALRPPETVMRLDRLGSAHANRLSFARRLMRRACAEGWTLSRPVWELDPAGFGHAVYTIATGARRYSLVAFSHDLPPEKRTDRVIAEAWDATFVLYDGVPDPDEIARLAGQAPLQEAGRFTARDLVLSRANKSVRLFEQVVALLAGGRQPDPRAIDEVGYLMRTTAVYGNGKFGIADRTRIADRPEFASPFQAEMLTVWLIRTFTVDLADHRARQRSPDRAVALAGTLRRRLGVGNSTGLGMAPFLVRHPALVHRWVLARETALARVRSLRDAREQDWAAFLQALEEARERADLWRTADAVQRGRVEALRQDLGRLAEMAAGHDRDGPAPWDAIYRWSESHLALEGQECVVGLLIEPHGALVDDLGGAMSADEDIHLVLDGRMRCDALLALIESRYAWALAMDFDTPSESARFWYVSAEKLEPRLGDRHEEPGADLEQPLAFARDVALLRTSLTSAGGGGTVAEFVLRHPDFRHVVRRVQLSARLPYAEIRDNLIAAAMRPIDLLRFKLACFGATSFDPRSDRWLRISLFQGAPFPDEVASAPEASRPG